MHLLIVLLPPTELLREAGLRLPSEPDERVADAGQRRHGEGEQRQFLRPDALGHGVRPLRRRPCGRHQRPGPSPRLHASVQGTSVPQGLKIRTVKQSNLSRFISAPVEHRLRVRVQRRRARPAAVLARCRPHLGPGEGGLLPRDPRLGRVRGQRP